MSFALQNLVNTNIRTFGTEKDMKSISFVFIGSILNEKNAIMIQPLDFESPTILSKAINIYKANRLAIITKKEDFIYIQVHIDLIPSLPPNGFCLFCKNQVIRYKFEQNKSLFALNTESYEKLNTGLRYWMADAYKHQNPKS